MDLSAAIGKGNVQTSPDYSDSIDHIVNRQYNNLRHAIRDNADNAPRPFETISTVAFDRHVYFYACGNILSYKK
jgi:hypothetical protein